LPSVVSTLLPKQGKTFPQRKPYYNISTYGCLHLFFSLQCQTTQTDYLLRKNTFYILQLRKWENKTKGLSLMCGLRLCRYIIENIFPIISKGNISLRFIMCFIGEVMVFCITYGLVGLGCSLYLAMLSFLN
jgi:hypothetical protein